MKIIRQGNAEGNMAPPALSAKVECKLCGSLLEITSIDILDDECGAIHHTSDNAFVKCEACKKFSTIDTRKLEWYRGNNVA